MHINKAGLKVLSFFMENSFISFCRIISIRGYNHIFKVECILY
ncbi:hypothetical protein RUMOBE_03897 [Blautia obeum ATCC 29174]|uniref:Uncharacterized protein n=1 Tax=Blautia obeum ATCC 29174 TaxID=411459 RepID=A5ZXZ1_9FIRM|nr:hypothetical protein RUMOBE_03897 [Blautia obeum ATCC 29174]